MSFADSLKTLAYNARAIPGQLGIRPYSVSIRLSTWAGDHVGDGVETVTVTPILEANGQNPKVRFLNEEQTALGGLVRGSLTVGPITPDPAGSPFSTLTQQGAQDGSTLLYIVTGPEFPTGARYQLVSATSDRALHYTLTLSPIADK